MLQEAPHMISTCCLRGRKRSLTREERTNSNRKMARDEPHYLDMAGGATPLRYGFRRKAGGGCSLGESRDKAATSGKEWVTGDNAWFQSHLVHISHFDQTTVLLPHLRTSNPNKTRTIYRLFTLTRQSGPQTVGEVLLYFILLSSQNQNNAI